jgi:LacI family transcriptional regulator
MHIVQKSKLDFMPKLQDVARRAGVSIATVSKVLSNTPYFSTETREKVLEAVKELGYRPHFAGRALSTGKTHIVGVVFPYIYDSILKDPLVLAIIEGIEDELNQQGYNLLLHTPRLTSESVDESYTELLRSGYLDGMIAIDSVPHSPLPEMAQTYGIPLVVLGYHNPILQVHSDDYRGGQLLMAHIIGLGHQQIGIIAIPPNKNVAVNERVRGLRDTAQANGLNFDALPRVDGNYSAKSGAQALQDLIKQHPHLTAVICLNDRMAIGAIQQLQKNGVRVPDEMTVVGYDNLSLAELMTPPLTTVSQHASQLGSKSAQMLLELLNGNTPSTAVLAPTLITRGTSAKPREMDSSLNN